MHGALHGVCDTSHHPASSKRGSSARRALATLPAGAGISQGTSHREPQVGAQHLPLLLNAETTHHSLYPSHPRVKPEVDYLVIYVPDVGQHVEIFPARQPCVSAAPHRIPREANPSPVRYCCWRRAGVSPGYHCKYLCHSAGALSPSPQPLGVS